MAGIRLVDDALRLLVRAGAGLLLALLVEAAIAMIALHEGVVDALYFSTRSVATVASAPGAAAAPTWFKAVSALDTLAALLLVAVFTAALVRRLSAPRLTAIFGPRAAPARGHVLLVGFGQVGFRLAQELRRRQVAVIGVERDPEAPCVRLARAAGIPVVIGRGDDREVLERVGICRCAAVAAVTSTDLVNVAVGLAASDLAPDAGLVLRLGDGEVAAETDSLLHLGRICDAHKIAAETLARGLVGAQTTQPAWLDRVLAMERTLIAELPAEDRRGRDRARLGQRAARPEERPVRDPARRNGDGPGGAGKGRAAERAERADLGADRGVGRHASPAPSLPTSA